MWRRVGETVRLVASVLPEKLFEVGSPVAHAAEGREQDGRVQAGRKWHALMAVEGLKRGLVPPQGGEELS